MTASVLSLRNSDATVLVDEQVKRQMEDTPRLMALSFFSSLRLHSAGYAVFQKSEKQPDNSTKIVTIYLHKYIAEHFLNRPKGAEKYSVRIKNDNKLDCRLENLEWTTASHLARKHKALGKTGYRGVYPYAKQFKALIYIDRKPCLIGIFPNPEDAAAAYNIKATEVYGAEAELNEIGKPRLDETRHKRPPKANYNSQVKRRLVKKTDEPGPNSSIV